MVTVINSCNWRQWNDSIWLSHSLFICDLVLWCIIIAIIERYCNWWVKKLLLWCWFVWINTKMKHYCPHQLPSVMCLHHMQLMHLILAMIACNTLFQMFSTFGWIFIQIEKDTTWCRSLILYGSPYFLRVLFVLSSFQWGIVFLILNKEEKLHVKILIRHSFLLCGWICFHWQLPSSSTINRIVLTSIYARLVFSYLKILQFFSIFE